MAERKNFKNSDIGSSIPEPEELAIGRQSSTTLKAGIEELSGVKKEDLQRALSDQGQTIRTAIGWVQEHYGVLIAAGLGVATVGVVTLLLNRRGGLRSFYEEESSQTVLH